MVKCLVVNVCANTVSVACILIPPWTCDTWIMCSHVCVWVSADRNEGHPDDLDIWEWRRLMEIYQILVFFCLFCFLCLYVWRIPPQLDQFSLLWTNTGQARAPFLLPSLFTVNEHPSDCQGIYQVVQQTLPSSFFVWFWGSISCPLVSVMVEMQGTSLEYCHSVMALRCLIHFFFYFVSKKIKEWWASLLFPGCYIWLSAELQLHATGNYFNFFFFMYSLTFFIPGINKWLKWK